MKFIFNKQLTTPLFVMLFGLLFFAIGSGLTYRQRTLEGKGIEAQGVVVNLYESSGSDGSTFSPIVQFTTSNGQSVEFVTSYYSSPPAYEIGEPVIVVYPLEDPENAIIKGDGQLFHVLFMLIGGIVAAVGSLLLFSTLRNIAIFNPEG